MCKFADDRKTHLIFVVIVVEPKIKLDGAHNIQNTNL